MMTARLARVGADPWALARRAAGSAGVELRPLTSLEDCDAILRVMIATWGDHQTIPREMIRALASSGNVPYGAFSGEDLVGYVLGWAGVDEEGLHVHSHMLAALPERRHRGVGYALKLAQRAQALERGIRLVRWTFDPLVARNAHFNLNKLGAVADRFERNYYGDMPDEINRGERSDRFVVRWELDREPPSASARSPSDVAGVRLVDVGPNAARFTGLPGPPPEPALVAIPEDHLELKRRAPGLAAGWRDAVAEALEACLSAGYRATSFVRGSADEQGVGSYVMTRHPS
jgi:predicted GNAT superfamily acetyltransferase